MPDPNGLCFSPDQNTLYLISTGKAPGDTGPGGKGNVFAFDVANGKLSNQRVFTDMHVDGVACGPDGMRADVFGNLWISSNAPLGYSGVLVINPAGKLIGLRRPETERALHDGQPIALCAAGANARRIAGLTGAGPPPGARDLAADAM